MTPEPTPRIVLRSVTLRPQGPPPMKRKVRGREVAGMVYACLACGWESKPITWPPNYSAAEKAHHCQLVRFEGDHNDQAAFVGPRFTHRERDGGGL